MRVARPGASAVMTDCCPTCNRPFIRAAFIRGPNRRALYNFIARHPDGVTREQALTAVYRSDPNGGPKKPNIISVMVHGINKQLASEGAAERIRGTGGPGSVYKIVRV
jgi:hypothetical protein